MTISINKHCSHVIAFVAFGAVSFAQPGGHSTVEVSYAAHQDISQPMRDIHRNRMSTESQRSLPEPPRLGFPAAINVNSSNPSLNLLGLGHAFTGPQGGFVFQGSPGSPNGAVGLTQYVQTVNISFAVFDKQTGAVIYGPALLNTLWKGFDGPCESTNNGDPIVAYDTIANRWMISQVSASSGTGYFQCVAVSISSDATGSYYRYAFQQPDWNDFAKLGVWPDAYYASFDMFAAGTSFIGARVCAFDRSAMLTGAVASQQCFQLSTADSSLLPADLDGSMPPPLGAPNHYFELDPASNSLQMFDFHVDWTDPAKTSLKAPIIIPVAPFNAACGATKITNTGLCIPQFGTKTRLDSMGDRLMHRLAYRNFGDHESIVVNHSVEAGTSVGVRWYELRKLSTTPFVYQQGTFAPDGNYRWLGSIAMDHAGDIALGYSVSGPTAPPAFPGIRYTGRDAADAYGTMQPETSIIEGSGPQTNTERWGDYSAMSIDPVDDCTFWYTNQYTAVGGATPWSSRIATLRFPSCFAQTLCLPQSNLRRGSCLAPVRPVRMP